MTPLGHAGIALLIAEGVAKVLPSISPTLIFTSFVSGGVLLDLDILYHSFSKKNLNIFSNNIGEHRNLYTHTPLFVTGIFFILFAIGYLLKSYELQIFGIFFATGALIHLFLDTLFFPEGVNMLFPFNRKMYRFCYINKPNRLAPKPISKVKEWPVNYLTSPLFWLTEVTPTILSLVVLFKQFI